MDNGYITKLEYEEHNKRMDDEHRRMYHRLAAVETATEQNNKLLLSVEKLAINMENMQKEQQAQREEFYKYTYADNEAAVRAEVRAVVEALTKLGVPKGCRVWYDLEEDDIIDKGPAHITKLYRAFKDELAQHGFVTGLYKGMYDYNNKINKEDFKNEAKWIARYYNGYNEMPFGTIPNEKCRPAPDCDGWQFTSSGIVDGIKGRVDMNIFYGEIVVPNVSPEYYDTPEFTLIDSLNKVGADSSFKNRAKIAKANNIQNYVDSVEQNLLMLQLLNEGKLIVA